jgi:hypothetical protein
MPIDAFSFRPSRTCWRIELGAKMGSLHKSVSFARQDMLTHAASRGSLFCKGRSEPGADSQETGGGTLVTDSQRDGRGRVGRGYARWREENMRRGRGLADRGLRGRSRRTRGRRPPCVSPRQAGRRGQVVRRSQGVIFDPGFQTRRVRPAHPAKREGSLESRLRAGRDNSLKDFRASQRGAAFAGQVSVRYAPHAAQALALRVARGGGQSDKRK